MEGRLSKIPSERNFKAKTNATNKIEPKTIHKTRRQAGGFRFSCGASGFQIFNQACEKVDASVGTFPALKTIATYLLAFYLAYLLALFLAYLLAFCLAFYLAYLLALFLTCFLVFLAIEARRRPLRSGLRSGAAHSDFEFPVEGRGEGEEEGRGEEK